MINEIKCAYCKAIATSGVNTIDLDEYYPVCDADLDRLVNDYQMMPVELLMDAHQWDTY